MLIRQLSGSSRVPVAEESAALGIQIAQEHTPGAL
jgi:hypothetical protein